MKEENVPAKVAHRSPALHLDPLQKATATIVNVLHNGGGNVRLVVAPGCQVARLVLDYEVFKDAVASVKVAGRAAAAQDVGFAQIVYERRRMVERLLLCRRRRDFEKVYRRCVGASVHGGSLVTWQ
jgi:hypothetical protein